MDDRISVVVGYFGGIGYEWNGGLTYRSGEKEFYCCYDIIHQMRIILM